MQYQLPSGKVIHLSVEEYLSLTDRELHELTYSGYGSEPSQNMYYGKKAKGPAPVETEEEIEIELDYTPESDELDTQGPIDLNNLPES
jgi:hypothetical protein